MWDSPLKLNRGKKYQLYRVKSSRPRRGFTPWTLLLVFLTLAPAVLADDESDFDFDEYWCERYLDFDNYSKTILEEKLSGMPILRRFLRRLMKDPFIHPAVKRVIKFSLEDADSSIVQLTGRVSRAVKVYSSGFAYYHHKNFRTQVDPRYTKTRTQRKKAQADLRDYATGMFAFLREKAKSGGRDRTLTVAVHEFAHIRFETFFDANIEKLISRLPPELGGRDSDGTIFIDSQLYEFLTERYALEINSALEGTINRRRYRTRPEPDLADWRTNSEAVARLFDISDPRVRALVDTPLRTILLGGPAREFQPEDEVEMPSNFFSMFAKFMDMRFEADLEERDSNP